MSLDRISDAVGLIEEGDVEEALTILEAISDKYPLYVIPRMLRARAHEAIGDPEGAVAAWREARFLAPENIHIQEGLQRTNRMLLELREAEIDPADETLDITPAEELETGLTGIVDTVPKPEEPESAPAEILTLLPEPGDPVPDELDNLIQQLEHSRIGPADEADDLPDPLEKEEGIELVSETLARIYVKQARHAEAARVYRLLAVQHPEKAEAYQKRATELDLRAHGSPDATSNPSD